MKRHWKPILTLAVLSSVLTEVLSGNTPITIFINPVIFLLFLTVGYGFPVLLIREVAFRKNLNVFGLFALGIIYGIYNEGLLAKTLLDLHHSPILAFADYGIVGTIRLPWMLIITVWHSLYAVIFPIMFVRYLFPLASRETWLGKKTMAIVLSLSLMFGLLAYFDTLPNNPSGTLGSLIFFVVVCLLLWNIAKHLVHKPFILNEGALQLSWKKYIGTGFGINGVFFLVPLLLGAAFHISLGIFVLYYLSLLALFARKVKRIETISLLAMVYVGIGAMMAMAVLGIFSGKGLYVLTSCISLIVFIVTVFKLKR